MRTLFSLLARLLCLLGSLLRFSLFLLGSLSGLLACAMLLSGACTDVRLWTQGREAEARVTSFLGACESEVAYADTEGRACTGRVISPFRNSRAGESCAIRYIPGEPRTLLAGQSELYLLMLFRALLLLLALLVTCCCARQMWRRQAKTLPPPPAETP